MGDLRRALLLGSAALAVLAAAGPAPALAGGAPLRSGEFVWEFGFNTFVETRRGWKFQIRDPNGRAIESCRVDPSAPC